MSENFVKKRIDGAWSPDGLRVQGFEVADEPRHGAEEISIEHHHRRRYVIERTTGRGRLSKSFETEDLTSPHGCHGIAELWIENSASGALCSGTDGTLEDVRCQWSLSCEQYSRKSEVISPRVEVP